MHGLSLLCTGLGDFLRDETDGCGRYQDKQEEPGKVVDALVFQPVINSLHWERLPGVVQQERCGRMAAVRGGVLLSCVRIPVPVMTAVVKFVRQFIVGFG